MEKKYDVLIVGSGVGGLYTSLSLPENLSVLMLSKKKRHAFEQLVGTGWCRRGLEL